MGYDAAVSHAVMAAAEDGEPLPEWLQQSVYAQLRSRCDSCGDRVWWLSESEARAEGLAIDESVVVAGAGGRVWQCVESPDHFGYFGPIGAGGG